LALQAATAVALPAQCLLPLLALPRRLAAAARRPPLLTQLGQLSLSTGVGAFLLARAACEMLGEALAAGWLAGRQAPVRRLMLLPQTGTYERMVRVCVCVCVCV
jgi:hypothetical protein